jgi:preprotein translocase subunit SecB
VFFSFTGTGNGRPGKQTRRTEDLHSENLSEGFLLRIAGYGEFHEVVLTLTVETKHDDKTLFLIELQQAGLFQIAGYTEQEFAAVVGSFCPNLLFPYAREAISGIVSRGGFPELLLQPINFDALYAQSRAELQNRAAQQSAAEAKAGNGGDSH